MTVTTGSRPLRRAWRRTTSSSLKPLRPGGADVVVAEHVDQARAGHPGDDRQRDRADGDRREDQVLGGVDDDLPVPLQQPVEHLEVGDEVEHAVLAEAPLLVERRGDEPRREPARGRQRDERVLERDGEEVLQQQSEHEDRHRHAGVGGDHRADVDRGVAPVGGDHAERDADDDREGEGEHRQLDRRRQALDEDLDDAAALAERLAEVAGEDVAEVLEELDRRSARSSPSRCVERVADLVGGPLAEGGPARIAGDHAGEDEDRDHDPEQHRDRREETVDDEADHDRASGGRSRSRSPENQIGWGLLLGGCRWIQEPQITVGEAAGSGTRRTAPPQYSKSPVRPTCRGSAASHWTW